MFRKYLQLRRGKRNSGHKLYLFSIVPLVRLDLLLFCARLHDPGSSLING